jgi:putative glutamine amidotransferase
VLIWIIKKLKPYQSIVYINHYFTKGDMRMRPSIGITTFCEDRPKKVYSSVPYNYLESVYMAGGIPVPLPIISDDEVIETYLGMLDGLLLTGGVDISPLMYGENPIKEVTGISIGRDEFEFKLFKKALEIDLPILGICRGMQLINAACGGTLFQDIYAQRKNTLGHDPYDTPYDTLYHSVRIEKGSKLYEIFEKTNIHVNSFHHQAVKDLGSDIRATAFSSDGIIEGIELDNKSFVVGVQWHPEGLTIKHPEFSSLFNRLVDEACRYSKEDR